MKSDLNYSEYILRYVNNEMSREEIVWFEKELEGNPALRREVDLHHQVDRVLADREMIELKQQLELIHSELEEVSARGNSIIRKGYRKIYYTTVGLAVAAVLLFVVFTSRTYSNEQLLNAYYQPAKITSVIRDADTENSTLTHAMKLYNNHKYNEAVVMFEEVLNDDNSQMGLNLYSGISHMEIKEFQKANERFQIIIDNKPNPFVESATWYLGMCYLMTDEREKALEKFSILAKNKGFYQTDAQKIIKHLKYSFMVSDYFN